MLNHRTIDTLHTVETPEGAQLQFAVAGPLARGLAWLVDALIRLVILIGMSMLIFAGLDFSSDDILSDNGVSVATGLFLMMQFLLSWFYTTLFEASTGTTPGKRLYKLWVIHDNGTPLNASGALVRNFLRAVDGLPFLNMVGLITMLVDNRFRRLGDLAAGTLVIFREQAATHYSFTHPQKLAPPAGLTQAERRSIVDFAERCNGLSEDRQSELAKTLSHLMADDEDPVDTIKSWAEWILRGQSNAEPTSI